MKPIIHLKEASPNSLIGIDYDGRRVIGWARTDTSSEGMRNVGFGRYHTDIVLKFEHGARERVTLSTPGAF